MESESKHIKFIWNCPNIYIYYVHWQFDASIKRMKMKNEFKTNWVILEENQRSAGKNKPTLLPRLPP